MNGALVFTKPTVVTTDGTVAGDVTGPTRDSSNVDWTDNDWDALGPGDVITYTSAYTVGAGDFTSGTMTRWRMACGGMAPKLSRESFLASPL